MMKLKIRPKENNNGYSITLDGTPIEDSLRGLVIDGSADADTFPRVTVTLELVVFVDAEIPGSYVRLDEGTVQVLEELGFTPPKDYQNINGFKSNKLSLVTE